MAFRRCDCKVLERLGAKPKVTLDSYELQIVPGPLPDKARMYPGAFLIQVDRAQWSAWTGIQRVAVLAHEMSHDDDASACEQCIDARAGARMKWQGISLDGAMDALQSVVSNRRVRENVRAGWEAAEAMQSRRGLRTMADFDVQNRSKNGRSVDIDLTDDPTVISGRAPSDDSSFPLVAVGIAAVVSIFIASKLG